MTGMSLDFKLDPSDDKPVRFSVSGVDKLGKAWREEFETVAPIPAEALDAVLGALTIDEQGDIVGKIPGLLRFMRAALRDEEYVTGEDGVTIEARPCDDIQRFTAMVRDKRRNIRYEKLAEVVQKVVEEITGRPLA